MIAALQIVDRCACAEFWHAVGVVTSLVILHVAWLYILLMSWPRIRRSIPWLRRHCVQTLVLAVVVAGIFKYGMTKGTVTFPYTDVETRYLYDAGSFVTNDYVHVAFTRSVVVPDTADFLGYVRPCGSTNDEDWVQMLATTFAAFHSPSNIPFANAISNDFQFLTTYTPGPVVHTNGVAVINWQKPFDGSTNRLATIRTGIYTDGRKLAPNPGITNGPPIVIYGNLNSNNGDQDNE